MSSYLTEYGFVMGPAEVMRTASINGTVCITIKGAEGHAVDVYVSPKGKSIRVWRAVNGKSQGELKPAPEEVEQ